MGKFTFGVGLLALFLALGLWTARYTRATQTPISQALEQAAQISLSEDLDTAAALGRQAKTAWETSWQAIASMSDHAPMDEIDGLFAQLDIYHQANDKTGFAATCARLCKLIEAMGEAHAPYWWNFL